MIQTVTNRRESTYENVLTINDQLSTVGHVFRCTVTNTLGSTTEDVQALGKSSLLLEAHEHAVKLFKGPLRCTTIIVLSLSNLYSFVRSLCFQLLLVHAYCADALFISYNCY